MLPKDRFGGTFVGLISLVPLLFCLFAVASVETTNLGLAGDDGQDQILQLSSLNQLEGDNNPRDHHHHHARHAEIYLESIDDLDHLSYLAMRNYNLTDERLLQSTWLTGTNQLETGQRVQDDPSAGPMGAGDPNNRLAFMLESLILHLKNGHLRRMSLEELEQIVNGQNLTESFESLRKRRHESGERPVETDQRANKLSANGAITLRRRQSFDQSGSSEGQTSSLTSADSDRMETGNDSELRCLLLVTLYKFDLGERARAQTSATIFPSNLQPSKPDDESSPLQLGSGLIQANETSQPPISKMGPEQPATMGPVLAQAGGEWRLIKLCKLAVNCHSSEELVNLISRPQKTTNIESESHTKPDPRPESFEKATKWNGNNNNALSQARDHLERDSSQSANTNSEPEGGAGDHLDDEEVRESDEGSMKLRHRKNLRDSVSLSLTKLCPLILFPLHEDDGQCMVRRDDRPPMITVWAFATLFVTIVCFCSLIGLSITPLIGNSATDFSADSSDTNEPAVFRYLPNFLFGSRSLPNPNNDKHNRHRASLTLFEGLAVGSLVGSALFSLLPQAFELQERESNQSFLLKAFIIFSGIYLFFLSERIMRIILDTRQKRKRKKRLLTHRSSTTAAVDLAGEPNHHQQRHALTSSSGHHQLLQHPYQKSLPSTGPGQGGGSLSRGRPSTSSRGSTGGPGAMGSRRHRLSVVTSQSGSINRVLAPNATRMHRRMDERNHEDEFQVTFLTGDNKKSRVVRRNKKSTLMTTTDDDHRQQRETPLTGDGDRDGQRKQTRNRATSKQHSRSRRGTRANKQNHHNRKVSNSTVFRTRTRTQNQLADRPRRSKQSSKQARQDNAKHQPSGDQKRTRLVPESGLLDGHHLYTHQLDSSSPTLSYFSSSTSCSSSPSSSSSSFSSYVFHENGRSRLASHRNGMLANAQASDSQMGYSSPSDSESVSICSSCPAYASEYCAMVALNNNLSDSDDDNNQRRAVSKRMSELTNHRLTTTMNSSSCDKKRGQDQPVAVGAAASTSSQPRTTLEFNSLEPEPLLGPYNGYNMGQGYCADPHWFKTKVGKKNANGACQNKQRDISTVAWMIILGDGLHNFIDGISIGAAFSESILSGVSISVAVICEEFPHELGDFAVLISSGMTIRQALGYNFLSACTCYFGMAVGIILGDVTDGASYISALAAGVFLYIALVDMMGELSAALESSSRYSIAKTLKLLLLQNVGIAIGISIIFVLSFMDF